MGLWREMAALPEPPVFALVRLAELGRRIGASRDELLATTKFAALFPRHAPAHRRLAEALTAAGDGGGAEREYRAALALDPASPRARASWARFLLGARRRAEAEPVVSALVRELPASPFALGPAALVDEADGRRSAALAKLDAALAERPDDAELLQDRLRIRRAEGDDAGAEADRRRLIERWPAAPESSAGGFRPTAGARSADQRRVAESRSHSAAVASSRSERAREARAEKSLAPRRCASSIATLDGGLPGPAAPPENSSR